VVLLLVLVVVVVGRRWWEGDVERTGGGAAGRWRLVWITPHQMCEAPCTGEGVDRCRFRVFVQQVKTQHTAGTA
jgi:hypothetical protein